MIELRFQISDDALIDIVVPVLAEDWKTNVTRFNEVKSDKTHYEYDGLVEWLEAALVMLDYYMTPDQFRELKFNYPFTKE
jgi:hypothetical protein